MPAITLDTVEEAFIAWRKNRSSRIEAIPQALWERVFHIYQDYSQAEICHRLRLNSGQCKKKMAEILAKSGKGSFVVAQSPTPHEPSVTTVTLCSSGRTLSVCVAINDIGHVLPHFEALL